MQNGINEARNKERISALKTLQGKMDGIERQVNKNKEKVTKTVDTANKNTRIMQERSEKEKEEIRKIRIENEKEKKEVERIDRSLIQTNLRLTNMQDEAKQEVRKLTTQIENVANTMSAEISNEIRTQLR